MVGRSYLGSARAEGTARHLTDFPIATYSLIALNLLLFVGALPGDRIDLSNRYGLIPDHVQFYSLFTAIFLHFDTTHLLINIAFLWLFGRKVERAVGPIEFLLFYIGSGFIASLLHVAISFAFLPSLRTVPLVGASGAVSGVLGMYAIRFRNDKIPIGPAELPAVILLLIWFMLQVALGIAALRSPSIGPLNLRYVGYWSHVGGFVFGMAAAWVTTVHGYRDKQGVSSGRPGDLRRSTLLEVAQRFEVLAAADPDDPFAYAELGRVSALLGEQEPSIANYLKAIELYRKAGRRDEALACLWEALRFWPETTLAYDAVFRFACYFEALGEYREAADRFAWLANSAGGAPEGEMALLKLGQVQLDRFRRPDLAAQTLERLIRDHPTSRWADLAAQLLARARSEETH